ncbi:chloride channel protein [Georgenia ruanii]|nr:chloride channel protein [Georgenia ruanii]
MRGRAAPAEWMRLVRLAVVTALIGVGGGVSGMVVSLGLHAVEHLAYGYSAGTFLSGVVGSAPWRRVLALAIAGVVGALGWWALRRWAKPVVSVQDSVQGARMPWLATVANAALQVVVVGLGASIGREVAPRELGALFAGWLSEKVGLTAVERRTLVACGAGAGLAAVYDVPVSGALFTLEVLLAQVTFATAVPALATAAIATLVARLALPAGPLYTLPQVEVTPSLVAWAVVAGPLLGLAGHGFVVLAQLAARHRPRGSAILLVMPAVFLVVGLLAVPFPFLLGNGRALGEVAFAATTSVGLLAALAVLKTAATTATIGAGAAGGTLTPSLAIGAALGGAFGGLWVLVWPGTPVAAFAFVAAGAFLATSMRAPFTALLLVVEFTDRGPALLLPAMIAIAGSVAVSQLMSRRWLTGVA